MPTSLYKIRGGGKHGLCRFTLGKGMSKTCVWNPRNWYVRSVVKTTRQTTFISNSDISSNRLREMSTEARFCANLCNNLCNIHKMLPSSVTQCNYRNWSYSCIELLSIRPCIVRFAVVA